MRDATARPAPARPAFLTHRFSAAIGIVLVVGAVLRLYGAQGELWLDEVWSLKLIHEVEADYDFLWALTIDNNHYLNTLYLALVGPDAPVIVLRGLSIVLGMLSIEASGWIMRRSGPAGVLAAMTMVAVSYPMVNYGSEARGYSGLILMTVLAIALIETALADPRRARPVLFGLVAAAGILFQPVMALTLAMLGLWAIWVSWRSTASVRQTERTILRIFMPAVALIAVIIAVLAIAIAKTGGYQFGGKTPFSVAGFFDGYGGLVRYLLGMPDLLPPWLALLAVPAALVPALAWRGRLTPHRLSLAVIALLLVPAVIFCIRPPNVAFPRYYLASGIVLLLLLADLFAAAWRAGAARRNIAAALAVLFLIGSGVLLQAFYEHGRGTVSAALRTIAADPDPGVTSTAESRDQPVIAYAAYRLDLPVRFIARSALCQEHPAWLLTSQTEPAPELTEVAGEGCKVFFRRVAVYPAWGLSGLPWTLYRVE